jgi:hypothetical protein
MMMKSRCVQRLLTLMLLAASMGFGTAEANPIGPDVPVWQQREFTVDIAGTPDNDERGAVTNAIRDIYVGSLASITAFKWNVNVTSSPGSYLSEMQITFSDTAGNGITFTPGSGDDFDGTADYSGFQDFRDLGLVFGVAGDGILRLEFHDLYKDLAFDEPEGMWNAGTLTFSVAEVPEPPVFALMLGGLVVLSRARRRRTAGAPSHAEIDVTGA